MSIDINKLLARADELDLPIDYNDENIIIMDNLKLMAEKLFNVKPPVMNVIAIVMSGRARVDINGMTIEVHENELFICPQGTVLSNFFISPDLELKVVLLSNNIIQSFLRDKIGVWNQALYVRRIRTLSLKPEGRDFFYHFYETLRIIIDASPDAVPFRTDILKSVICAGLLGLCGTLSREMTTKDSLTADDVDSKRSARNLFQHFLNILSACEVKHRPVTYYASELCVTPKYLSVVCRQISGKTAGEWITEYTMEDIRHYLRATDLSMKQVCDSLGFPSPSFFSRYVREHFGMSPKELRDNAPKDNVSL